MLRCLLTLFLLNKNETKGLCWIMLTFCWISLQNGADLLVMNKNSSLPQTENDALVSVSAFVCLIATFTVLKRKTEPAVLT